MWQTTLFILPPKELTSQDMGWNILWCAHTFPDNVQSVMIMQWGPNWTAKQTAVFFCFFYCCSKYFYGKGSFAPTSYLIWKTKDVGESTDKSYLVKTSTKLSNGVKRGKLNKIFSFVWFSPQPIEMFMVMDSHLKKQLQALKIKDRQAWCATLIWGLKQDPNNPPCNALRRLERNTRTFEHTIQTILFTSPSSVQVLQMCAWPAFSWVISTWKLV